ncbi:hypothetical protein BJ981_004660 [Sphaerisporangium krabiense]|uniref:Uncharacterized protein n=1 Tax=Sphaerisporangium krabiense TaxID=763782 RepID=A0A7W8Z7T3_9ACTN|nr:hypothetical protein [Sphaerisporangium krabiense]
MAAVATQLAHLLKRLGLPRAGTSEGLDEDGTGRRPFVA